MALHIIRDDITRVKADAIVNSTGRSLRPTGGADAAIHRAAGPRLQEAVRKLGTIQPGQAAVTPGFSLPCRYVIHTVGPRWYDGHSQERQILSQCYINCLRLAVSNGCRSVALPLIASGHFGFPKEQALYIAVTEIRNFLLHTELDVTLVVFDEKSFQISKKKYHDIRAYINQNYDDGSALRRRFSSADEIGKTQCYLEDACYAPAEPPLARAEAFAPKSAKEFSLSGLQQQIAQLDESFSQMLLRKIDESGMTDAQCYKKANIDRKLFSKIRSDPNYRPSKVTVLSFAVALELPLDEAKDMLQKAGFALSRSSKFDVIIEYFLRNKIYDLYQINEALFAFDQVLLAV